MYRVYITITQPYMPIFTVLKSNALPPPLFANNTQVVASFWQKTEIQSPIRVFYLQPCESDREKSDPVTGRFLNPLCDYLTTSRSGSGKE